MKNSIMLIVNPVAGKGTAKSAVFDIVSVFGQSGYAPTVYMTGKHGDAEEFAEKYGPEYDIVACVGGDGTLSEVANGLSKLEDPPFLGYVPLGTTNDVAATLKLPKSAKQCAQNIVSGEPMPLDIGKFGDKYFVYVAAFGAFTEVPYSTPQETKNILGHLAYVLEGMSSLPKITAKHAVVEYDGGVLEGDFLFGAVTNSTRFAGIVKLNPETVELGDGFFEVMLIKTPKNIAELNTIAANLLAQSYEDENIVFLHTQKIKFRFDEPVAWTRDGENGGTFTEVVTENLNQKLKIII